MLLRLHAVFYFFIVSGMGGDRGWVGGRGTGTLLRKGLEAGEMKGNYQTALNISQSKEGYRKEGRNRGGSRQSTEVFGFEFHQLSNPFFPYY